MSHEEIRAFCERVEAALTRTPVPQMAATRDETWKLLQCCRFLREETDVAWKAFFEASMKYSVMADERDALKSENETLRRREQGHAKNQIPS